MSKNFKLYDFFEQCMVSMGSLLSKLKFITYISPATNSHKKLENLKEIKRRVSDRKVKALKSLMTPNGSIKKMKRKNL